MKSSSFLILTLLTLAFIFTIISCEKPANDESHYQSPTPGLALQMHYIQNWTHKLALSIDAENDELTHFYHHELEESMDDLIDTVDFYDGFPVAELANSMLVPQLEALEEAIDAGDWAQIRARFEILVSTCNSCHVATDHGYIVITNGFGINLYNQDFSKQ